MRVKKHEITIQDLIAFVKSYKGISFDFSQSRATVNKCGCLLVEYIRQIHPNPEFIHCGFTNVIVGPTDAYDLIGCGGLIHKLCNKSSLNGILSKEKTLKILKEHLNGNSV